MANEKTKNKKNSTPKKTTTKKVASKKEVKKEEVKVVEKKEIKKEVKVEEKKKCLFAKKNIIIASISLALIIGLVVLLLVLFNPEARIKRRVKSMGKEFYTEYFWDSLADARSKKELKEVMDKYTNTGFKVRFNTLTTYGSGKWKKEIDSFELKNKKCNQVKSMVIIYPKKDFGKHDYKIDVVLDCNIEK